MVADIWRCPKRMGGDTRFGPDSWRPVSKSGPDSWILLKEYILIPHDRIATLSRGTQAGWKAGPRRQSGATTAAGCDHARPFSLCSVSGS